MTDHRGLISIVVIWALAVSGLLLLSVGLSGRLGAREVSNFVGFIQAGYAARSGIALAKAEIAQPVDYHALDEDGELIFGLLEGEETESAADKGSHRLQITIGDGTVDYDIVDEERKINLNRVTEDILARLVNLIGIDNPVERATIVDSILDWMDNNHLHRLNGAEDDYYRSLEPPYEARDGSFLGLAELLLVRGITDDVFYGSEDPDDQKTGLVGLLTIKSTPGKVNLNTAGPLVLEAWFGNQIMDQVLDQRKRSLYLAGAHGLSDHFTITAVGTSPRGGARTIRALVKRDGEGSLAVTVLDWYDDFGDLRGTSL